MSFLCSEKDVQKACKKVVKDVLKKGLDELETCKAYLWLVSSFSLAAEMNWRRAKPMVGVLLLACC